MTGGRVRYGDLFVWSRAAIWLVAVLAPLVVAAAPDPVSQAPLVALTRDLATAVEVWAHWDGVSYVGIADRGYDVYPDATAFYPLFPVLVAVLGRVLLGHFVLAGIAISLAACWASFALLARLGALHLTAAGARRAVLFLAVFPTSFFLQAVYAEALFLALTLAAFLLAERGRFGWAAAAAGAAALTRPLGLALLPSLAVLAWRSHRRGRALARLAAAPLLPLAYPLLLWQQIGDPWAFTRAEGAWGRETTPLGPLQGLWDGAHATWAALLQLTVGSDERWYWTATAPARVAALNLEYAVFLVVIAGLTVVAWRRLGAAYGLYPALTLGIVLAVPTPTYPLLSISRFGLVLFPLFLALASLTEGRPRLATAIAGTSAVLLGFGVARFALWQFVA